MMDLVSLLHSDLRIFCSFSNAFLWDLMSWWIAHSLDDGKMDRICNSDRFFILLYPTEPVVSFDAILKILRDGWLQLGTRNYIFSNILGHVFFICNIVTFYYLIQTVSHYLKLFRSTLENVKQHALNYLSWYVIVFVIIIENMFSEILKNL